MVIMSKDEDKKDAENEVKSQEDLKNIRSSVFDKPSKGGMTK
jgi:hypothetical protein